MSGFETHRFQGAPDLVSVTTQNHAVIICEGCGMVWEASVIGSYEIPEVVERHAGRHIHGDLREKDQ